MMLGVVHAACSKDRGESAGTGTSPPAGNGPSCAMNEDCPMSDNPCRLPLCIGSQCTVIELQDGSTPDAAEGPDACARLECADGSPVLAEVDEPQTADTFNECTVQHCEKGEWRSIPAPK